MDSSIVAIGLSAVGALLWTGRQAQRLDALELRVAEHRALADRQRDEHQASFRQVLDALAELSRELVGLRVEVMRLATRQDADHCTSEACPMKRATE